MPAVRAAAGIAGRRQRGAHPYLWQAATNSADVVRGSDTPDEALLPGIRQARELGLRVLVKPHLWVNNARLGNARMADDAGADA